VISYTYGEMPPYDVFSKQVDAQTPPEYGTGIVYPMELADEDEISAVQLVLHDINESAQQRSWTPQYKFRVVLWGKRTLYQFLTDLNDFAESSVEGDEDDAEILQQADKVQGLVGAILGTLGIEWV
jgi:hypothetical protein